MFFKIVRKSIYKSMQQKIKDLEMQKTVYENLHKQDIEEKEMFNKEVVKKVSDIERTLDTVRIKDLRKSLKDLFSFLKKK